MDKKNETPTSFTNTLNGMSWDATAEVFPLMCPATGMNCHPLCACFKENRTTTTFRATDEDIAYRTDGYAFGDCTLYRFTIGAYRD